MLADISVHRWIDRWKDPRGRWRRPVMSEKDCCWDFGFGAWGGQRGRRFRWRIFERGDLKFVILRLISEKPMHGYEVMQALEEESGGWYKASPGSVYPTLQMLEDEGYVQSTEEDGKKTYEITDAGRTYLEDHGDIVDEIVDRVTSFADRFWGKESRTLSASFSRLAQSAFESAFAWGLDDESIQKITEILDQAHADIQEVRRQGRPEQEPEAGEKRGTVKDEEEY
jgi:DNA-binding PadR family transcriptional regulator